MRYKKISVIILSVLLSYMVTGCSFLNEILDEESLPNQKMTTQTNSQNEKKTEAANGSDKQVTSTAETRTGVYVEDIIVQITDTHYMGDILSADDFDITVKMSDGSVLHNPSGWGAAPLELTDENNQILVAYEDKTITISVPALYKEGYSKAESQISEGQKTEGKYKLGDKVDLKPSREESLKRLVLNTNWDAAYKRENRGTGIYWMLDFDTHTMIYFSKGRGNKYGDVEIYQYEGDYRKGELCTYRDLDYKNEVSISCFKLVNGNFTSGFLDNNGEYYASWGMNSYDKLSVMSVDSGLSIAKKCINSDGVTDYRVLAL